MSDDRNILGFIRNICASGESGRLELLAGAIQGELSFADGKLVDARVGHLTGFRAVNAVAAMQNTRFSFDPTFAPLASSSITASEQVVLKQFFGIETVAASRYLEPVTTVADEVDEVTLVQSEAPEAEIPTPPPPPPQTSRLPNRTALAFAALVIAVIAAAAVLIHRSRESRSPVVANVASQSSPQPVQQPVQTPEPAVAVHSARDLSGKWTLVNTIETTSYSSFKNMKIGFDLSINQTGATFTGSGHKVSENGRSLPVSSRTPIQVKGSIDGDRIEATFFEEGAARKSNGKFVWRINQTGRGLTGKFATTAARSSGRSAATREL